jgi:prepilin-type N-terminal cleavage/methylation domain-containing protein
MRKLRGFTLIELLIVVAIIAILAAIAVPNFLEAQVRSKVSRVRSDHRSLATAIESYYVDNNKYPAWTRDTSDCADHGLIPDSSEGIGVAPGVTFRVREEGVTAGNEFFTLTTPIAYITSYFPDPFADTRGLTFRYYAVRSKWWLGSFGPDVDESGNSFDVDWTALGAPDTYGPSQLANQTSNITDFETVFTDGSAADTYLLWVSYDPTNGTVSEGDVFRIKQ